MAKGTNRPSPRLSVNSAPAREYRPVRSGRPSLLGLGAVTVIFYIGYYLYCLFTILCGHGRCGGIPGAWPPGAARDHAAARRYPADVRVRLRLGVRRRAADDQPAPEGPARGRTGPHDAARDADLLLRGPGRRGRGDRGTGFDHARPGA